MEKIDLYALGFQTLSVNFTNMLNTVSILTCKLLVARNFYNLFHQQLSTILRLTLLLETNRFYAQLLSSNQHQKAYICQKIDRKLLDRKAAFCL